MAATFEARAKAIRDSPKLRAAAWRAGVLWWLLDRHQYRTYLAIRAALGTPFARFVLRWARRTGKTYLLILLVLEECLRNGGRRYNIAAATKESLAEFVWPTVYSILETCPESLRPWIREAKGRMVFRRVGRPDSVAVLAGCNDRRSVERLRGPYAHGNVYEEIGAMPDVPGLGYVQSSILRPQILTTGGWELMAGTPPPHTGHEAAGIFARAEADGRNYSYATLYDNPRLTVSQYQASTDYRREWLALIETDPTLAVLPECGAERMWGPSLRPAGVWEDGAPAHAWHWPGEAPGVLGLPSEDRPAPPVVRVMPDVPLFRDRYEAMDLGFHPHFTHILFGYWDFPRRVLVIEDELQMRRLSDSQLAWAIGGRRDAVTKERLPGEEGKEWQLWGRSPPYLRVSDNNYPMTISELAMTHGLVFVPTAKDEKEAAILQVRRWIREGRIAVHPRCRHLIAQMQAAVWNKHRTEFAESPEFGHYDAIDALVYLVRNVVPNVDRVPDGWGIDKENTTWRPRGEVVSPATETLRRVFGGH
jgi:hypothetical protein